MKMMITAGLLGIGAVSTLLVGSAPPASAQMSVFDTSNYAQNLLTAARTLTQINNQIQSLQNETQMIANQSKNLAKVDFKEMAGIQQRLGQIDKLMGQAQGINFHLDELEKEYGAAFPAKIENLLKRDARLAEAKKRLDSAMGGFRQAMRVQSGIVENVRDDAEALKAIVDKSQGAEGGLQAQQATNQLLALATKQQFQIQQLMAAQFREQSLEGARRGQIEREARDATRRFLGNGRAYTPPK